MTSTALISDISDQRVGWERLYSAYAAYYKVDQTREMRDRVHGWIMDGSITCIMALDDAGKPVGIAHIREFIRPLMASKGGFLDDLFVDPASRGGGVVMSLLAGVSDLARQRDWTVIRWITREDNYRARAVYDRIATKTNWVTYDMKP